MLGCQIFVIARIACLLNKLSSKPCSRLPPPWSFRTCAISSPLARTHRKMRAWNHSAGCGELYNLTRLSGRACQSNYHAVAPDSIRSAVLQKRKNQPPSCDCYRGPKTILPLHLGPIFNQSHILNVTSGGAWEMFFVLCCALLHRGLHPSRSRYETKNMNKMRLKAACLAVVSV